MVDHPKESTHFYTKNGEPAYTVIGANGKERPTTLRDARKKNLLPSVTSVIRLANKEGLNQWIIEQTILSCLTMPKIEGETEADYIARLKSDSKEQARKAAEKGTEIHKWIQDGLQTTIAKEGTRYLDSVNKTLLSECGAIEWRSEKSFATPRYGGKVDLYSDDHLIDVKTTEKELATVKTWDEHSMQLAAYDAGIHFNLSNKLDPPYRRCGILYVHVLTAESKIIWLTDEEVRRGWKCFCALLDFFYAKTSLGEGL